ncbi:MAG TPA: cation transporter, partial [Thiolapillus brandeum]|nr:cation transporter [Thiolapillus brandeum]
PSLVTASDAQEVRQALSGLPGLGELAPDLEKHRLQVLYDVRQLDYRTLLEALARAGHPVPMNPFARIVAALRQYADTNARDNAKAPPPPCCNKPPR